MGFSLEEDFVSRMGAAGSIPCAGKTEKWRKDEKRVWRKKQKDGIS
jgi:hypothetical protein